MPRDVEPQQSRPGGVTPTTWTIAEFAAQVGRSVSTLKRWDSAGTLKACRWPSGVRYYTAHHLKQVRPDLSAPPAATGDPVPSETACR